MTRYAIGLGSNMGDRRRRLVEAARELVVHADEWEVSGLYETEPVGGPKQGPYLNAVIVIETDLEPLELLELCQDIEARHGRERTIRWGPRSLDLDILTSDGEPADYTNLVIPHPRATERSFVLVPLNDVWPEAPLGEGLDAAAALEQGSRDSVELLGHDWFE